MSTFMKLQEAGKSFLWFLGAFIFLAQTYRIIAFYMFEKPMDIVWYRDGGVAMVAFAMMFIQSGLKTAVRKIIKRKSNDSNAG